MWVKPQHNPTVTIKNMVITPKYLNLCRTDECWNPVAATARLPPASGARRVNEGKWTMEVSVLGTEIKLKINRAAALLTHREARRDGPWA
jgi:hypothetical protein